MYRFYDIVYNAISWWSRAEFKPMAILEVGRGTVTLWAKGIYPWPCTDLSNGSMRQNIISDMWSPDIPVNLITGLKCYQTQGHCSHRSLWKRLSWSYVTLNLWMSCTTRWTPQWWASLARNTGEHPSGKSSSYFLSGYLSCPPHPHQPLPISLGI